MIHQAMGNPGYKSSRREVTNMILHHATDRKSMISRSVREIRRRKRTIDNGNLAGAENKKHSYDW